VRHVTVWTALEHLGRVLVDQFGVCSIMPAGAVAKPAWVGLSEWQVAQRWVMMAWMRVKSGVVAAAAAGALACAEAPAGTAAATGTTGATGRGAMATATASSRPRRRSDSPPTPALVAQVEEVADQHAGRHDGRQHQPAVRMG
jgi:hypothetical protein